MVEQLIKEGTELIPEISAWVGMGVTGFITWYFTKKKTKSEKAKEEIANNKSEIDTLKAAFDLQNEQYKNMLALKDNKVDEVLFIVSKLTAKVEQCEREIAELKGLLEKKDNRIVHIIKCAKGCLNRKPDEVCPVLESEKE